MADYKGIKGFKVQSLASDPTADEGQTWYNTTSNTLKYDTIGTNAWSTAGLLNTHRPDMFAAAFGTTTATICAGGWSAPIVTLACEEYNGTAWAEIADLTFTAYTRNTAAGGTTTASLIFGGNAQNAPAYTSVDTESWNGTSWTEVADLNSARAAGGGAGTQNSALMFGGFGPAQPGNTAETEEWNGTSWAVIPAGDMNVTTNRFGGWGTQTAAMAVAGSPNRNTTETYDGATWSSNPATLNNGRDNCCGAGTTTAAVLCGGNPPNILKTEQFNGTSWTAMTDSSIGKGDAAASGSSTAALGIGGSVSPYKNVELWEYAPAQVKTVTTS